MTPWTDWSECKRESRDSIVCAKYRTRKITSEAKGLGTCDEKGFLKEEEHCSQTECPGEKSY